MAEPRHKRARPPPPGDGDEGGGGRALPLGRLEAIHDRLARGCLCPLELPDVLRTLALCNECFSSRPAAHLPLMRDGTLLYVGMLTLFFEVSLRQRSRGILCSRVGQVAAAGADGEGAVLDVLFGLMASGDVLVSYSASRALSALLLSLRGRACEAVLERLVGNAASSASLVEAAHSAEAVRRVVEWRDPDEHPLEGPESGRPQECAGVVLAPAEARGPDEVRRAAARQLGRGWTPLVGRLTRLVEDFAPEGEHAVVSFLALWEALISVKANLPVADTKEFYSGLERLLAPLVRRAPAVVWRKVLDLYNEVLCYGSTLALQDVLAEEPCTLAHLLIRAVKDRRLLERVPGGPPEAGGTAGTARGDRTVLHKVVLVALKAVAVTVKETRCDSSSEGSSRSGGSGSEDVDMVIIERSLREVVRKVDRFVKARLPFHPEAPMAEWMVRLFADQDDWLVESMVCGLDIFTGLGLRIRQQPELHACVNPHTTFLVFLESVYLDHDVLLDLLVSNETSFLLYLLRYLKFIRRSWHEFASHCGRQLGEVMTVLIRLRFAIDRLVSKNIFPYNINPVLKLLQKCEELYEVGDH